MTEFFWDGTHIEDCGLPNWLSENYQPDDNQVIDSHCNLVGYKDKKGCCHIVINGHPVRWGDTITFQDGKYDIVRGETKPFICPTHKVEHLGTGFYICITTGQNI